jgi:hypothetical protein
MSDFVEQKRAERELTSAAKRSKLEAAKSASDGKWTECTPYHWQRRWHDCLVDYWPTTCRWQFTINGRRGCVVIGNTAQDVYTSMREEGVM